VRDDPSGYARQNRQSLRASKVAGKRFLITVLGNQKYEKLN